MKRLMILLCLLAGLQGANAQLELPYTYKIADSYANGSYYCKDTYDTFSCENTHCILCDPLTCSAGEYITTSQYGLYHDNVYGYVCIPKASNGSLEVVANVNDVNNPDKYKLGEIKLDFTLSPYEFLGYCNQTGIEENDIGSWLECSGNFFSPVIPNPGHILDPISGHFQDNINIIEGKILSINVLSGLSDLIIWLVGSLILLLWSSLKYLLIFGIKFLFVYLFYVSLSLQMIIWYFDRNSQGLSGERKIEATLGLMIFLTIFILWYGGGWIQWV